MAAALLCGGANVVHGQAPVASDPGSTGLAVAAAATAQPPRAHETGSLRITIAGIQARRGGELMIALYDHASEWLSQDSVVVARRVPVTGDSITITLDSLPCDSGYAVAVIHDQNRNGKLDMRWFPFPKPREGAGVSGNHMGMGPPRYEPARFDLLDAQRSVRIMMKY